MLERTNTFRRFILWSPSLLWDDERLLRRELNEPHRRLGATNVFLSVGERENRPTMIAFAREFGQYLRDKHPEIALTTVEFPEETHGSVVAIALLKGIRAVYQDDAAGTGAR